jgi:hypothetical protein
MVLANFLQPRMNVTELISPLNAHFPTYIQRAWVSPNLMTAEQVVSFLQQLKAIGHKEPNWKSNQIPQT